MNKSPSRIQPQANHSVENSATNKTLSKESSYKEAIQKHVTCGVQLQTSHSVESLATKNRTLESHLQTSHTVECLATNKLPYSELIQLQNNQRVKIQPITLWIVELETNRPVESSAIS